MVRLTERQAQVLKYICDYFLVHGRVPTHRDIGTFIDCSSTNAVNDHLNALARKGWIERTKTKGQGHGKSHDYRVLVTHTGVRVRAMLVPLFAVDTITKALGGTNA